MTALALCAAGCGWGTGEQRAVARVFCSGQGLALAGSGCFTVAECHLDLDKRSRSVLRALRKHALALCLASITISDWWNEDVLEYLQFAALMVRAPVGADALTNSGLCCFPCC